MEETPEYQVGEVIEPIEQETIVFYGKPLVGVRLPNGEPGAVLRYFCENLGLAQNRQIDRIKRKKALAAGLHYVKIETAGGPQIVAALTLRVMPAWLFGIDTSRVKPELQADIERYQAECVDVLYQWASHPRLQAPSGLVSEKQIEQPTAPESGAGLDAWRTYLKLMLEFLDWRESLEEWRGSTEERIESIEAVIPLILERLPDPIITVEHQTRVRYYVSQLHQKTSKPYATIYSALQAAFQVPRYQELREDQWDQIERWFQKQLTGN